MLPEPVPVPGDGPTVDPLGGEGGGATTQAPPPAVPVSVVVIFASVNKASAASARSPAALAAVCDGAVLAHEAVTAETNAALPVESPAPDGLSSPPAPVPAQGPGASGPAGGGAP